MFVDVNFILLYNTWNSVCYVLSFCMPEYCYHIIKIKYYMMILVAYITAGLDPGSASAVAQTNLFTLRLTPPERSDISLLFVIVQDLPDRAQRFIESMSFTEPPPSVVSLTFQGLNPSTEYENSVSWYFTDGDSILSILIATTRK